ncbi:TetR/AcrR family transcriptional regulator [Roseibium sp. CAU 1637]|uniref:TetR/AcrR family transcriptional regulator n=1 Tax=Roseibium limicola TaxID=2816037 RepID=A0A939J659_9HYPH|nr:TetR/AcrR family transcriptional regulator [Roseibium limicola]MBO0344782.1 TetR/AcrR family transcriptional regulator [Roseibium limicola]
MSLEPPSRKTAGRPRSFDLDQVLDRAIPVFSERGLNGTAISDLKPATGLTAGSLYKCFTDKNDIFRQALEHYGQHRKALLADVAAHQGRGVDKLTLLLEAYGEKCSGDAGKRGCLVVLSTAELSGLDEVSRGLVLSALAEVEAALEATIVEGSRDGSMRADLDPPATASLLWCMLLGLRLVGKTGIDRKAVSSVVQQALRLVT